MRRMIVAALMAVSTVGMLVIPAGADPTAPKLTMSFDYSDNSDRASVNNGPFNIIVDVVPESVNGLVRMVAVPPADSNQPKQFCTYQWTDVNSQVECSFAFTTDGVWRIRAIYQQAPKADATASAYTNLRVSN